MSAESGAGHFSSVAAREHAAHLGMWIFLGTEVLLFGGLLTAYGVFRVAYPGVFLEARHHMEVGLGTLNTYLLVLASVLVALSIHFVREERRTTAMLLLVGAVVLGLCFLGVKTLEYARHVHEGALPGAWYHLEGFNEPGARIYFTLYYLLTGLHAVHVTVGVGVLAVMAVRVASGEQNARSHTALEVGGMYWHLVDIIWLFLWPMLYLA